jgi:heptosyltransferase II
MSIIKEIELFARTHIFRIVAYFLRVKAQPLALPAAPKILLIRCDKRLGNCLMSLPLFDAIRNQIEGCEISLLGHVHLRKLVAPHLSIDHYLPFDKWGKDGGMGIMSTLRTIRLQSYDVVIDSGNPTRHSVTQALLTRFSGAKHTLGLDHFPFGVLYTCSVARDIKNSHDIEQRLQVLRPLLGSISMALPKLHNPSVSPHRDAKDKIVIHIGSRLQSRTLSEDLYRNIIETVGQKDMQALVTYGLVESDLAQRLCDQVQHAILAPDLDLMELSQYIIGAKALIVADTGPMHLGVAFGVPTCGLFINSSPGRYGYKEYPHTLIDLRKSDKEQCQLRLSAWLDQRHDATRIK